MTLVSVVVPVYDDLEHVAGAIESVTEQGDHAVEVVVVHSGDRERFPERLRERPDVTYANRPAEGVAAARNEGIDLARGDVIGFCDADDCWLPSKLDCQLPALAAGADVVYADEYLERDGGRYRRRSLPVRDPERHHVDFFRNGGGVGSRSVLARAECFERERFDERFAVREDPHLWTRLFAAFTPSRIAEPLTCKRDGTDTLSSDVDRAVRMERLEIADLCTRYPELRPYREQRERQLRYRYAKRLLTVDGRAAEARRVLRGLRADGESGLRLWSLLACATLPAGNRWVTRRLQDALWWTRSFGDRLDCVADRVGEPLRSTPSS